VDEALVDAAAAEALRPFSAEGVEPAVGPPENPYTLHQELQQAMNDLVGIIRREGEMAQALEKLAELQVRARRAGVEGHRQFNPGWHLALDLRNMLLVSECVARAALERTESRGVPGWSSRVAPYQSAVPAHRPHGRVGGDRSRPGPDRPDP
jgi:succinate dehydrogenase / fumarate reductase flavoprotein subunit